jgi:serine/threonine-protein kinase TNNI3K
MLDIAKGVMYPHKNKVIHRDIKAKNILLMRNKIKTTDFGLSKQLITNKFTRSSKMTRGIETHPYMAPEMVDLDNYGYEVDIWATRIIFI